MRTIPSPHGELLHHEHRHDGAALEHDRHSGHRHFRRHGHGHDRGFERGEGFARRERFGDRGHGYGRGHGHGRGRNALAASPAGREDIHALIAVSQEIRSALRNLAHRGAPDQLAEAQRLLEETRRSLYLILATEPEALATEPETAPTENATEVGTPPQIA